MTFPDPCEAPPPSVHTFSVAALAAITLHAADAWFVKKEHLALQELIRLAQRWEDYIIAQHAEREAAEAQRISRGL